MGRRPAASERIPDRWWSLIEWWKWSKKNDWKVNNFGFIIGIVSFLIGVGGFLFSWYTWDPKADKKRHDDLVATLDRAFVEHGLPSTPSPSPPPISGVTIFVGFSPDKDIDQALAGALARKLRNSGLEITADRKTATIVIGIAFTGATQPQIDLDHSKAMYSTTARLELAVTANHKVLMTDERIDGSAEAEDADTAKDDALLDAITNAARRIQSLIAR